MKHLFLIIGILVASFVFSQNHYNVGKDKLAVEGYDVVAYFNNKAIKGQSKYTAIQNGIKYQFSTQANMNTFKANPTKYLPQYGGWCAYAMGKSGEKVNIDPKTFKVTVGKLYLFYNQFFNNTLTEWNKDEKNLMKKADYNWSKLK